MCRCTGRHAHGEEKRREEKNREDTIREEMRYDVMPLKRRSEERKGEGREL